MAQGQIGSGLLQVGVGGVEPLRDKSKDFFADVQQLFKKDIPQAVETYNTIGETAAKLDFRDMSQDAALRTVALDKRMSELAPDDKAGYEALLTEVDGIKSEFTKKLSKYSDHKVAYDLFQDSTADMFIKLDVKANAYNEKRHTANGLQLVSSVTKDGDLGVNANLTSFDASKLSLESQFGKEKATTATQIAYFSPLYAQASQAKDSKNIKEEMSVVDGKLGYATIEKVNDFMNNNILQNSEMAKFSIVDDGKGNKTFKVTSPFSEEQNAKLVAMANFYMGKHAPAKDGTEQYPFLNSMADVVSSTITTANATDNMVELNSLRASINKQFEDYSKNDESGRIEKDSPQHQKLYKTQADAITVLNKRTAIITASNSGRTVAENTASPLQYEIASFAKLMYPEEKGVNNSTGFISNDELKAAYKHFDNESLAALQANDPARAQMLSDKYKKLTGSDSSQVDSYLNVLANTGISTATTIQEASSQKKLLTEKWNRGQMSDTDYYAIISGIDSQITHATKDGKLTPAGNTGMYNALGSKALEKWSLNPHNKIKLDEAKTTPWLSDAIISAETFQKTESVLIQKGLMKRGDDPKAIGRLVASHLVYGMNKTLLPKLEELTENQMVDGMAQFIRTYAKQQKINIDTSPDNIRIEVDASNTAYLVRYKLSSGGWSTDNILISPKQIAIHHDWYKNKVPVDVTKSGPKKRNYQGK